MIRRRKMLLQQVRVLTSALAMRPPAKDVDVRMKPQSTERIDPAAPIPHREPRILCIDDDPEYTQVLKLRLKPFGINVLRASNGLDGYCDAVTQPADAILLDYQLPNGPGDYILARLKSNPVTKSIPVIVITGRKDHVLKSTLMNRGAARFLQKPLDFAELMAELSRHLPPRIALPSC